MRPVILLTALVVCCLPPASAQAPDSPFAGVFVVRSSPAPAGSAEPNLATGPDGAIWMSWQERLADRTHRLRIARLAAEGWSEPVTVAEGSFFANWADFPSIFFTRDGTLAVHWLERDGQGTYAYGVRVRTSRDGRTWTDTAIPHSDRSPVEHGFVAFYDDPASGLGLVWLDGRDTGGHEGQGAMTLRSASVVNGRPASEQLLDPKVCDCCQTAATATDDGVVVAYRDRSDDEIRDMSVVRLVNGRWTRPFTLHADGWQINACPVNGPALAAQGRTVAAAWFTAAGGTPRTRVAFSTDAGATFGAPIEVSSGSATMGRVGMLMLDRDRVLVSSLERGSDGGRLVIRQVRRDGRVGEPTVVAAMSPERASGFARMALDRERRLFVAWTDVTRGAPPQVRLAAARIN